jgi:hypothetical protein
VSFSKKIFHDREIIIATKHHKEKVIAPLFESHFNSKCIVPKNIDTDMLGTFSGEVERKENILFTLRAKCLLAFDQEKCDLVIASEGSFGTHPSMFFAKANEEWVMLYDKTNNIEIVGKIITTNTNYNKKKITSLSELESFCNKVFFPSHGLILRSSEGVNSSIIKGLTSKRQ